MHRLNLKFRIELKLSTSVDLEILCQKVQEHSTSHDVINYNNKICSSTIMVQYTCMQALNSLVLIILITFSFNSNVSNVPVYTLIYFHINVQRLHSLKKDSET